MYKKFEKIVTEEKLSDLFNHEVINNFTKIYSKLLKNSKNTIDSPIFKQKYEDIRSCLISNLFLISDLLDSINLIESSLSKIKYRISKDNDFSITVSIDDIEHISEIVKDEFKNIFDPLINESEIILKEITKIENIKKDLMFLFFYYDEWGSTLYSDIALKKEHAHIVNDGGEFFDFCKKRILGLNFNKSINIIDDEIKDMERRVFERTDPELFSKNIEYSKNMYNELNTSICTSILNSFLIIIRKMRHSCRTVQREIIRINSEEKFNDEKFREILNYIFNEFKAQKFEVIDYKKRLKLIKTLRLLYDYKKDIEERHTLSKIEDEMELHNHIEEYLTRIRKDEKLNITHEGKKARGHLDFQINNEICIELKINNEGYSTIDDLIKKNLSQIKEYMADRDNNLGMLIGLDLSKQSESHASRMNYFKPIISKGGRSVKSDNDIDPTGIIAVLIFGGERITPSKL